jgi:2-desacetyl-2-hydroxyethyl bacteriochlorophyllide A dehydrogenase
MTVKKFPRHRPDRHKVETSIVIRVFNEEKHLLALYEGLNQQVYRDFEIVIVDSGSFDRSRDISEAYVDTLAQIASHDFTFGHSLNVGIEQSRGEFVAIISAHTLPVGDQWLAKLIDPLRDRMTAMVYGCQRGWKTSKFGEILDFQRTFASKRRILSPPNYFANNANSAIRRELWQRHPFDETLPGLEDIEWAKYWMEHGHRVVYEPEAGIYHIHEESWPQVRRRYYREGQAAKWIGVRGRRDLAAEAWREMSSFASDLVTAARQHRLLAKSSEIARFRYEKLIGTCKGIWDGARTDNPLQRRRLLFDKSYRAVVIQRSGRASLVDMELPRVRPGEVLIRVAFQAICATDLEILDGNLGYYKSGVASYPIVPGHEFSGVVALVGARVSDLREGDPVVVECIQGCGQCVECNRENAIGCEQRSEIGVIGRNGGYAEYVLTPARFVHKLPPTIGLKEAALCEPLAVTLKGLRRLDASAGLRIGSPAMVIGAGPIGHLAARLLHRRGHAVTVVDRNASRLAYFEGTSVATVTEAADYSGFGVIVEATGDAESLENVLSRARAGSVLLLLGFPYGERPFNFERVVGYDLNVVGSVGSTTRDFKEAIQILAKLDLAAFTKAIVPLSDFELGWEMARSRRYLKVMLRVDETLAEATPPRAAGEPLAAIAAQ